MSNYISTTRNIIVSVEPIYLSDQSAPEDDYYVWAYKVEIENKGVETVQIRSRFWRITDSFGRTQETRGLGVVGEQPVLRPGEKFEYTSGTPLQAPSGMMGGNYQVQTTDGDLFEVEIPLFSLDSPHDIKRMH
jgi:ApaG protein